MESLELFFLAENHCEEETDKQIKKSLYLNDEILDLNLKIYNKYFNQKPPETCDYPFAIIVLQNKILKSLRCLTILLKKGYYSEFQSIMRDILDLTRKSQYFLEHPEKSMDWIKGKEIKFGKINPNLSDSASWGRLYGDLCDFTHGHFRSTFWEITIYSESREMSLKKTPIFQKPIAYELISRLLTFNLLTFLIFEDFLKKFHNDLDPTETKEFRELIKKWVQHLEKLEKYQTNPKDISSMKFSKKK